MCFGSAVALLPSGYAYCNGVVRLETMAKYPSVDGHEVKPKIAQIFKLAAICLFGVGPDVQ